MTASSRTLTLDPPAPPDAAPVAASELPLARPTGESRWGDRTVFSLVMLGLTLLFALLQNPYWVPSGDSEVYIAIARDLARDGTYTFNGQPVAMVPPGWPWVMAGVMKLSPHFLPLKLLAMSLMIGALACAYRIVRRYLPPGRTALVILVTGVLSHVYQCTYWLISESLFCFVSSLALLLALQVNEGRRGAVWRVGLLAALCAFAVMVRWAGVLGLGLVAAALVQGQWRPRPNRQWVAVALCAVFTTTTFFVLREAQEVTPEQAAAAADFGGTGEDVGDGEVEIADTEVARGYSMITKTGRGDTRLGRVMAWGRWFSWLYYQPFRAAAGHEALGLLADVTGWIVIALLLVTATVAALRMQWLWLGVIGYCGILAFNWPNVNARYLVPIAFLITLGIVLAGEHLRRWAGARTGWRRAVSAAFGLFVVSTVLCNAGLWAIEVSVQRSRDFYAAYEAGDPQRLISICHFINARQPKDRQIAVSSRYNNLFRERSSPFGLRATALLTGKTIAAAPWSRTKAFPPTKRLTSWLHGNQVRWYIVQPPVNPWRVWHFRVPWWQERRTGMPVDYSVLSGWQLYRVDSQQKITRVEVPAIEHWPTRVPGL